MKPRDYLERLELHGIKLGLEHIHTLLDGAGNPQDAVPCVHIAGTNGKGSVAAFLAHILMAAGYRVARFTSPHITRVNERFLIDHESISDDALDEQITFFQEIARHRIESPPTFFEMNTAIAFRWFAREKVDISIIEVGMGGRLDSTNVVKPLACAITSIDFDHTQYLGATLTAIAGEKAGILKSGVPAVLGDLSDEARAAVSARAAELGCPVLLPGVVTSHGVPLHPVIEYKSASLAFGPCPLGLAGEHQMGNAAVAVALAELLSERFRHITTDAIAAGLTHTTWPGRLECVSRNPVVYLDAAHNPAGTASLAHTFAATGAVVVFSAAADKDHAEMIAHLARFAGHIVFTQFSGTRATSAAELANCVPVSITRDICPDMVQAIEIGLCQAEMQGLPLLICGSIFALAPARAALAKFVS